MSSQFPLPDEPSILIIRLGALGNIIHTLPAVYAIREKYPFETGHIGENIKLFRKHFLAAIVTKGNAATCAVLKS